MLRRSTLALAGAGRCGFHAGRVLDPELRRQLPSPVPRDEFTVLKCLARTADTGADCVPHYAIDDSLFLRYRQSTVALAKRSGRNMARYFLEKNAVELADLNKECPPVPAWRPLRPLDQLDCSEASLRLLIGLERVQLSWQMYNQLLSDHGGQAAVGEETRQSLLELLAYHAGAEPPMRDISPEEVYFAERQLDVAAKSASGWTAPDNPALVLYSFIERPSLAAKAVMLKAHCRHGAFAECLALYDQVAAEPGLDLESHNSALLAAAAHKRSWPAALAQFRRLPRLDARSYRCLLVALALADDAGNQHRLAELVCSLLAEMAGRGLDLSLATCTAALRAAYASQLKHSQLNAHRGPTDWSSNPGQPNACVGLLPSMLDALKAQPPDPLDADCPDDLAFFPTAAFLACRVYASCALSDQLDALLHSGAFVSTLATLKERRIVYEYQLLNLLADTSVPLDAALRYYVDRIEPSGVALQSHLIRLMRRCVTRQAVDRLPGLMLRCLPFVDRLSPSVLGPGQAFFRGAEIVAQMFVDAHPATLEADFLADLRRCLDGFATSLHNEFAYEKRRRQDDQKADLKSSMDADSCATLLQLATRLPGDADREFAVRLADTLAECLTAKRTSSLAYMLAMLELAAALRLTPSYEQRSVCQSVAALLDKVVHEFQVKRSDKSDTKQLGRLAELTQGANDYLAACGHQLTETQAASHLRLARSIAELRDRASQNLSAAAAGGALDAAGQDDSAWDVANDDSADAGFPAESAASESSSSDSEDDADGPR